MRFLSLSAAAGILGMASLASATVYNGNGATGFGGPIGNGTLSVTADGVGNVTFTLNNASGFSGNDLVVYIDSVTGGVANTSTLADAQDGGRQSISAFNPGNPSRVSVAFPTGFAADYALEFENDTYDGLFQISGGAATATNFAYIGGNSPSTVGGPYVVTVPLSYLGLTTGQGFTFVADLISTTGYGSNETIGASVTTTPDGSAPNAGNNGAITFTTANTFGVVSTPEPASLSLLGLASLAGLRRRRA